ncbi:hypothetical protein JNJ66_03640 [Candidatus Saccharibacteria bacterium]|nr:hypothetical protein [Candidatus Saccharibacteria bacterium]
MVTKVQESVKVLTAFDDRRLAARPIQMVWNERAYRLGPVDFLHATQKGVERIYHFSLSEAAGSMYMKLAFHSHSMVWILEEIEEDGGR